MQILLKDDTQIYKQFVENEFVPSLRRRHGLRDREYLKDDVSNNSGNVDIFDGHVDIIDKRTPGSHLR